ncbi:hypothetical protein AA909_06060 [Vibrio anguillarum]|nr:hypothetical protein AA909_06060 [Vibrio anguillarum]
MLADFIARQLLLCLSCGKKKPRAKGAGRIQINIGVNKKKQHIGSYSKKKNLTACKFLNALLTTLIETEHFTISSILKPFFSIYF